MSPSGSESLRMYSSSGAASRKFRGTMIPPSLFSASSISRNTLLFAMSAANLVPFLTPISCSACARRLILALNSRLLSSRSPYLIQCSSG